MRHIKTSHQDIKIQRCWECRLFFKAEKEKLNHQRRCHFSRHQCIFCSKTFNNSRNLHSHVNKQHESEGFRCSYTKKCVDIFKTNDERHEHVIKVHGSQPNGKLCIYCNNIVSKHNLARHIYACHKSIAIQCEYGKRCGKFFLSKEERKKHYLEVHEIGANKIRCGVCKLMVSCDIFLQHMRRRHNKVSRGDKASEGCNGKCPFCLIVYADLAQHMRLKHKSTAIKCNFWCNKYFADEKERQEHILSVHSYSDKKYLKKCFYCGEMVTKYCMHIKKNHSKTAIRCSFKYCATYFHSKEELKKHTEELHFIQEKHKLCKCSQCNFKSVSLKELNIHVLRMHSYHRVECGICKRIFKSDSNLKFHIKYVHDKRKQCSICKKFVHDLVKHALEGNC
jgi:hypothetical protein